MQVRILSLAVIFSLVGSVACSPLKYKVNKEKVPAPPPSAPRKGGGDGSSGGTVLRVSGGRKTCTTENDSSLDSTRVIQRKTINLKRQHLISKDCSGKVISDTYLSPTQELTLVSSLKTEDPILAQASIYNRTSCDARGAELMRVFLDLSGVGLIQEMAQSWRSDKSGLPRTRFTVDTSPTWSSMYVIKNHENYIDYEFTKCVEKEKVDDQDKCKRRETLERGTLILTVNYTEDEAPGDVKINTPAECK